MEGVPYKTNPIKPGKSVLVVDDICTQGNSFEAARLFVQAAGARAIALSWLKTINTHYNAISREVPIPDPYHPITVQDVLRRVPVVAHEYSSAINDVKATLDLAQVYRRYKTWDWPAGL